MFAESLGTESKNYRGCCKKRKVAFITVQTPEGEIEYHLCEKHFNLEFFREHQIVWGQSHE